MCKKFMKVTTELNYTQYKFVTSTVGGVINKICINRCNFITQYIGDKHVSNYAPQNNLTMGFNYALLAVGLNLTRNNMRIFCPNMIIN